MGDPVKEYKFRIPEVDLISWLGGNSQGFNN